jgi:hypothetical protein
VVVAADLPGRLAAQLGRGVQGRGVGDAGQEDLDAAGVEDDLAAVVAPPGGELSFAVRHRDDFDSLAAGIAEPDRERYRANLCDLVEAH